MSDLICEHQVSAQLLCIPDRVKEILRFFTLFLYAQKKVFVIGATYEDISAQCKVQPIVEPAVDTGLEVVE